MMEDKTIKLLYINSKVHALVDINQAPAGETGPGAITQPIAANASFFITMLPLENEKSFVYLPYTRRVSIAGNGAIFSNDGLIDLTVWPDNIIELNLYPEAVYKNDERELYPAVLTPFDFFIGGERHTAFIYNEAYSSFVVEHASSGRLKFISPLPFNVASADISFTKLDDFPVIYAAGKTTDNDTFIYAASVLPAFNTAVCSVCAAYHFDGDGLFVVTDGEYRQVKTRYEKSGAGLAPVGKELGWFTTDEKEPTTPDMICMSLLQVVKAGHEDAAMACLTPSLADGLSFSDIKEFFGDFLFSAKTISPACGQSGIALKYAAGKNLYIAREFCIETKSSQGSLLIDNIREP
ncbi:MAG: hypothetical protein PHO15_01975 [Eubacteriales bacterium]|nr:hypothetical protein [Eubacteriales bacterium]